MLSHMLVKSLWIMPLLTVALSANALEPHLLGMAATPGKVDNPNRFIDAAAFNFFLKPNGQLYVSGKNTFGGLGTGSPRDAYIINPTLVGDGYKKIRKGKFHALALKQDGTLWAWGENSDGAVGDGSTVNRYMPVMIGADYTDIQASLYSSFALKADGSLWAWGYNLRGELGDKSYENRLTPVQVMNNVQAISAPNEGVALVHTLALKTDGTVYDVAYRSTLNDGGYRTVAAASSHNLGIKTDGTLWGWGQGYSAGAPYPDTIIPPTQIGTDKTYADIRAGDKLSVALKQDGSLWLWGDSSLNDSPKRPTTPERIDTGYITLLDTYGGIKADGSAWAWGNPIFAPSGATEYSWSPDGTVTGLRVSRSAFTQIGAGFDRVVANRYSTVIALKADGSAYAWGRQGLGMLGDTRASAHIPVAVGHRFSKVAVGGGHVLALKAEGSLWVWGFNTYGELGVGANDRSSRTTPTMIGTDFADIAAGRDHSLAVKRDGTLWGWGYHVFGRVGDGSGQDQGSPVQIGRDFAAVAAGDEHSAAIARDGSVWTWGSNAYGQADPAGYYESTYSKPRLLYSGGYRAITASPYETCALSTDGNMDCWGSRQKSKKRYTPAVPIKELVPGATGSYLSTDGSLWRYEQKVTSNVANAWVYGSVNLSVGATDRYVSNTIFTRPDGSLWAQGDASFGRMPIPAIPQFAVPRHLVIDTQAIRQAECLFDWAQFIYPELFGPENYTPRDEGGFHFRYFATSQSALGTANDQLYYYGPLSRNTIMPLGPVANWLVQAACD